MRPTILATLAILLATSPRYAAADPAPRAGTLFAAAADAGDWRLHPDVDLAPTWTYAPLLSIDARGVHTRHDRLGRAATAVAVIGALLIASQRHGSWCSGARCELGEAALLVGAPILDAAARESESGH